MSGQGSRGGSCKIDACWFASGHGIPSHIVSLEPNILKRIMIDGEIPGTYFPPNPENLKFTTIKCGYHK